MQRGRGRVWPAVAAVLSAASGARLRSPGPAGLSSPSWTPAEAVDIATEAAADAAAAARDAWRILEAAGEAPLREAPVPTFDVQIEAGAEDARHPYEGIGALSAGASSRLLRDYPKEQRGEILDLLFRPGYGASLQVLKVEIGGDMQSTDGSEPSHMRARGERPDCTRGYETWLMQEAKARNPTMRTYGLAWGVPGWIGNGSFFTPDNIHYHVSWLRCVRDTYGFEVDYLGIWNEMPWGEVWYIGALAQSIAAHNLSTRLVLLDAIHGVDAGFVKLFSRNETFRRLVAAVGLHYPCERAAPLAEALAAHPATRFWASEELSTVADWGGAGCWGRMINQNFVRMNATSSIAWSLVWSAYPNLECFGNGLLYAYEPWSGHYEVTPPVWTTAHTTQFTEVGWQYLPNGSGAGLLEAGGTFVTIASPELDDFTVVLETLRGECFYHAGCHHRKEADGPQRLRLHFGAGAGGGGRPATALADAALRRGGQLEVWVTNQTHWFARQPDLQLDVNGTGEVTLQADAILTVSTLRRASRRGERGLTPPQRSGRPAPRAPPPPSAFPLPFREGFDSHGSTREPPFFADQGGAFEIVAADQLGDHDGDGSAADTALEPPRRPGMNKVLEQQVLVPPIAWIGHSPDPFTLIGGVNWTDIGAEVGVRLGPPEPPGAAAAGATGGAGTASSASALAATAGPASSSVAPTGTGAAPPAASPQGPAHAAAAGAPAPAAAAAAPATGATARHVGLCARISRYQFFGGARSVPEGYCLRIIEAPSCMWVLTAADQPLASGPLVAADVAGWLHLRLEARGARLRALLNGREVASTIDTSFPFGQVALRCGYHRCQFDDLRIAALAPPPPPPPPPGGKGRRALLYSASTATFDYHSRSCDPAPRFAPRRQDFTGFVGFAFAPAAPLTVQALGRLVVSGGHPWARVHNVSLFAQAPVPSGQGAAAPELLASVALPTAAVDQVGVEQWEDGWVFAELRRPVLLWPGREYLLVSSELANGDAFYDKGVRASADREVLLHGPAFLDTGAKWHVLPQAPLVYGPLNALLGPAPAAAPLRRFGGGGSSAVAASTAATGAVAAAAGGGPRAGSGRQ